LQRFGPFQLSLQKFNSESGILPGFLHVSIEIRQAKGRGFSSIA
jgi:hypothetical protein